MFCLRTVGGGSLSERLARHYEPASKNRRHRASSVAPFWLNLLPVHDSLPERWHLNVEHEAIATWVRKEHSAWCRGQLSVAEIETKVKSDGKGECRLGGG